MNFDHHHGVAPAEQITPQKDENHEAGGAVTFKGQGKANTLDCAQTDVERKPFAKQAAHAALADCTLHALASGGFLLCRWGMGKELPDLRAVAALLVQIGGRS